MAKGITAVDVPSHKAWLGDTVSTVGVGLTVITKLVVYEQPASVAVVTVIVDVAGTFAGLLAWNGGRKFVEPLAYTEPPINTLVLSDVQLKVGVIEGISVVTK